MMVVAQNSQVPRGALALSEPPKKSPQKLIVFLFPSITSITVYVSLAPHSNIYTDSRFHSLHYRNWLLCTRQCGRHVGVIRQIWWADLNHRVAPC